MTHLSLFSGIGGLDLAAEWAGFETAGQCEFAEYPYKVLCKHWPDVPKWRDVRGLTGESFRERTGIKRPTVISGGFPCQPHSLAGQRKASCDERELWPEYRRVISEINPLWVVAENVRGLLSSENGRFFRGILRDFADLGFDVGWCTYRAADIGAIHARERVAIIAHAKSERRFVRNVQQQKRLTDMPFAFVQEGIQQNATDYLLPAIQWEDVEPVRGVLRNDDGRSDGMDRLKCLGNAVVPQQFYPIFKAIAEVEYESRSQNLQSPDNI